jgi:hypothetical protein
MRGTDTSEQAPSQGDAEQPQPLPDVRETVMFIPLDEVKEIRIVCEKCGPVVEVSILKMLNASGKLLHCPVCPNNSTVLREAAGGQGDYLGAMATAFTNLKQTKGVRIQFILPAKE